MIEQGKIIELNHNKLYTVVSTAILNGEKYLYLMGHEDETDVMFAREKRTETGINVVELDDDENITEIAQALFDNGVQGLKDFPVEQEGVE